MMRDFFGKRRIASGRPRRRRILKAVAWTAVTVLVGAVVVFIAGWDIPPPNTHDLLLPHPSVAPNDNAGTFFNRARETLYWPDEHLASAPLIERYMKGNADDDDNTYVSEIIRRNITTLTFIAQGLDRKVYFHQEVDDDVMPRHITAMNRIGRLLALKSRRDRLAGNFTAATDACVLLLRLGDTIQGNAPLLIDFIIGAAILSRGLTQAHDLTDENDLADADLERLASTLDALTPLEQGLISGLKGEYAYWADLVDQVHDLNAGTNQVSEELQYIVSPHSLRMKSISRYYFQPNRTKKMLADLARHWIRQAPRAIADVEDYDVIAALGFPSWLNDDMELWDPLYDVLEYAIKFTMPNIAGVEILLASQRPCVCGGPLKMDSLKTRWRIEQQISETRLLVARHLYRRRYGDYPAELIDLVPDFLEALPNSDAKECDQRNPTRDVIDRETIHHE